MRKYANKIAILAIALSTLLLTGCGPIYSTTYQYVPPKHRHGRRCANRCLTQKPMCENNCNILHQACRMEANAAAEPSYRAYLKAVRKGGQTPWRNLSSFADYSNCGGDCGCETNYNQCFVNCGGEIIPHTVCTAFCDKVKK